MPDTPEPPMPQPPAAQTCPFRPVEVERLASPEQLDRLMRIADPKGWIALVALAALVLGVVVWSAVGTIATTVRGQGVLIHEAGGFHVTSPVAGQVIAVTAATGGVVRPGEVVARIAERDGRVVAVRTPFHERVDVLESLAKEGEYVAAGAPIASVDMPDAPLRAVLYLPAMTGQQVRPGMVAAVYPASARREAYGFVRGRVEWVAGEPATVQGMTALLGNETLVRTLFQAAGGTPLEVAIRLERAGTPSGLAWSSSRGPDAPLRAGTLGTVEITIGAQRPLSLVFPAVR
jgi:biotin carboxyl carrier protein